MRYGKRAIWAAGLCLAAITAQPAGAVPAAKAPTDFSSQQRRRVPPRITVVPLSHYYRQCDSWLALEHRPSGDVITPQMRCRWALR
jgi:hypothetical protein